VTYFLDARLTPDESTHVFVGNQLHACAPQPKRGFYAFAIRQRGTPGWVFRFTAAQERDALLTLGALNEQAWERAA
jgi:hypothetical protein